MSQTVFGTQHVSRPRFQFGLRTLFLLMAVCSLGCYWIIRPTFMARRFATAVQSNDFPTLNSILVDRRRPFAIACTLVAAVAVTAISYGFNSQASSADPPLAPFEFHREGAASAEDAATMLFRGVTMESPSHFVQHLLVGVCDGPIDTLQKFAECLHTTEFSHGADSFTFYGLRDSRKGIDREKPVRVIAYEPFDPEDKQVAALQFEMMSTYYGETFMSVDVAAEGYDGLEYQTRIVVAQVGGRWYAMPRCRSAKSFYEIADAMHLAPHEAESDE